KPVFTIAVVFTLMLGIGANTAIFSIVNALILRPYPYIDTDKWVYAWEKPLESSQIQRLSTSSPNMRDWKQQSQSFTAMGAFMPWSYNLSGVGDPERVQATIISPDIFSELGIVPAAGRLLVP